MRLSLKFGVLKFKYVVENIRYRRTKKKSSINYNFKITNKNLLFYALFVIYQNISKNIDYSNVILDRKNAPIP